MILILMGVVGSGKTTVGKLLAAKLSWDFADADDFHSPENVRKMSQGIGLTDADRVPWLASLRAAIEAWQAEGRNAVLACSALRHAYREELRSGNVQFVYLKGEARLIDERLRARRGHYASGTILESQLATLEEPTDAITVSIDQPPDAIVASVFQQMKLAPMGYPDATQK